MTEHTPPASHSSRYNLRQRDPPPTPPTPSDKPKPRSSTTAPPPSTRRLRSASRPPHPSATPNMPPNPSSSTASHRTPLRRSTRRSNISSPLPPRPSPSPSSSSRTPSRRQPPRNASRPQVITASSPAPRRVTRSMQEPPPTPAPLTSPASRRTSSRRRPPLVLDHSTVHQASDNALQHNLNQTPASSQRGDPPVTPRRSRRVSSRDSDTQRPITSYTEQTTEDVTAEHRADATPRRQSTRTKKSAEYSQDNADHSISEGVQATGTVPDLDEWRYIDMRQECMRRGLSSRGRKAELKERLLKSWQVHQDEHESAAHKDTNSSERGTNSKAGDAAKFASGIASDQVEQDVSGSESSVRIRRTRKGRPKNHQGTSADSESGGKLYTQDTTTEKRAEANKRADVSRAAQTHRASDDAQLEGHVFDEGDEKMHVDVLVSGEGTEYVVNLHKDVQKTVASCDKAPSTVDSKDKGELSGKPPSSSRGESPERLRNPSQTEREARAPSNAEIGQLVSRGNNLDKQAVTESQGKDTMEDIGVSERLPTAEKRFDSQKNNSQLGMPPEANASQLETTTKTPRIDKAPRSGHYENADNAKNETGGAIVSGSLHRNHIDEVGKVVNFEFQAVIAAHSLQKKASSEDCVAKPVMNLGEHTNVDAGCKVIAHCAEETEQQETPMESDTHGKAASNDRPLEDYGAKCEAGSDVENERAAKSRDDQEASNFAFIEAPEQTEVADMTSTAAEGRNLTIGKDRSAPDLPRSSHHEAKNSVVLDTHVHVGNQVALPGAPVPNNGGKDCGNGSAASPPTNVAQRSGSSPKGSNEEKRASLEKPAPRNSVQVQPSILDTTSAFGTSHAQESIPLPVQINSGTAGSSTKCTTAQGDIAAGVSTRDEDRAKIDIHSTLDSDPRVVSEQKPTTARSTGPLFPHSQQQKPANQVSDGGTEDVRMIPIHGKVTTSGHMRGMDTSADLAEREHHVPEREKLPGGSVSCKNMEAELMGGMHQTEADDFDESPLPSPRPMTPIIGLNVPRGLPSNAHEKEVAVTSDLMTDLLVNVNNVAADLRPVSPTVPEGDGLDRNGNPAAALPAIAAMGDSHLEDVELSQQESAGHGDNSDDQSDVVVIVEDDTPENPEIGNVFGDISTPQSDDLDAGHSIAREDNPPSDDPSQSQDGRSEGNEDQELEDVIMDEVVSVRTSESEEVGNNGLVETPSDVEVSQESRSSQASEPIVISDGDDQSSQGSSDSGGSVAPSPRSGASSGSEQVPGMPGALPDTSSEESDEIHAAPAEQNSMDGLRYHEEEDDILEEIAIADADTGVAMYLEKDAADTTAAVTSKQTVAENQHSVGLEAIRKTDNRDSNRNEANNEIMENHSNLLLKRTSIVQSSKTPFEAAPQRLENVGNTSDSLADCASVDYKAPPLRWTKSSRTDMQKLLQKLPCEATREDFERETLGSIGGAEEKVMTKALPSSVQIGVPSQTSTPQARTVPNHANVASLNAPTQRNTPVRDLFSNPPGLHAQVAHIPVTVAQQQQGVGRKRKYEEQVQGNQGGNSHARVHPSPDTVPAVKRQKVHPTRVPIPVMPSVDNTLRNFKPSFGPGKGFFAGRPEVNRSLDFGERKGRPNSTVLQKLAEMERKHTQRQFKPFRDTFAEMEKSNRDGQQNFANLEPVFCMGSVSQKRRFPAHSPRRRISMRVIHSRPSWDLKALAAQSVQRAVQLAQKVGTWKEDGCPFDSGNKNVEDRTYRSVKRSCEPSSDSLEGYGCRKRRR